MEQGTSTVAHTPTHTYSERGKESVHQNCATHSLTTEERYDHDHEHDHDHDHDFGHEVQLSR